MVTFEDVKNSEEINSLILNSQKTIKRFRVYRAFSKAHYNCIK